MGPFVRIVRGLIASHAAKPAGRPPKGKHWDADLGIFVTTVLGAHETDVGLGDASTLEHAGADDEVEERSNGPRKFRKCWLSALPFVVCSKIIDGVCSSDAGMSCTGCSLCSVMKCSACVISGTKNVYGAESPGCRNFHVYLFINCVL